MATHVSENPPSPRKIENQDEEQSNILYYATNFDRLCRLCLSSDQLVSIYSNVQGRNVYYMRNFVKLALDLLSVKINIHDKMPKFICEQCELSLSVIFNFKKKCDKSFAVLQRVRDTIIKPRDSSNVNPEDVEKVQRRRKRRSISKQPSCEEILKKLPSAINVEKLDVSSAEKCTVEPDPTRSSVVEPNESVNSIKTRTEEGDDRDQEHVRDQEHETIQEDSKRGHSEEQVAAMEIKESDLPKCEGLIIDLPEKAKDGLGSDKGSSNHHVRTVCRIFGAIVNNIDSHMASHSDLLPYQCEQCPKRFVTLGKMKRHINDVPQQLRKRFSKCDPLKHSVEPDPSRSSTVESNQKIDLTNTRSEEKDTLDEEQHVQETEHYDSERGLSEEQMDPTECWQGGKESVVPKFESLVIEVLEKANDGSGFEKSQCQSNEQRGTACSICGAVVNNVNSHMISHSDVLPYQCDRCPKRFLTRGKMKKHTNNVHLRKHSTQCAQCKKTFVGRQHLQAHINSVHLRKRDFICETCGKAFRDKSNLNSHRRIHGGQRNYACHLCPKTFMSASTLRCHELTHTQEKKHECQHCGKSFLLRTTLRRHTNIHTDSRPHQCDLCDKQFRTSTDKTVHMRTHTGEKPVACYFCEVSFSNHKVRSKHMKSKHLDDLKRMGLIDSKGHIKRK